MKKMLLFIVIAITSSASIKSAEFPEEAPKRAFQLEDIQTPSLQLIAAWNIARNNTLIPEDFPQGLINLVNFFKAFAQKHPKIVTPIEKWQLSSWIDLFYFAAETNFTDILPYLMQLGIPVDLRPNKGYWTPLMKAAINRNLRFFQALLDKGANPLLTHGFSLIEYNLFNCMLEQPLRSNKDVDTIIEMLTFLSQKIDINKLHIVNRLLSALWIGLIPERFPGERDKLLHILDFVLKTQQFDPTTLNNFLEMALIYPTAAEAIKLLLAYGADPRAIGSHGISILQNYQQNMYQPDPDIIELLENKVSELESREAE